MQQAVLIHFFLYNGNSTFNPGFGVYDITNSLYRTWINNSGNFGIGTTAPVTLLHVQGKGSFGDAVTSTNATRAFNLASSDAVMRVLRVDVSNAPAVELISRTSANGSDKSYWDMYTAPSDASFRIRERKNGADTNRFIIAQATGNVGIGTTAPTEKLSVNGNIRTQKVIVTQTGWVLIITSVKMR